VAIGTSLTKSAAPRPSHRETFGSRFGTIITMIGVALGLGNIWRFPYMAGTFGGAAFVLQ
jgi:neurotransmitter:Na+ symporter, NSS family